jgi:hypothetical protein
MSRSSETGGRTRRPVDAVLVIALATVVGLLTVLRADLEVGATALVLGIAGLVGFGVGATTRPAIHRHGALLLAALIIPTIALSRWTGPYGLIWLLASGTGAVAGRSYARGSPPAGSTIAPAVDEGQRDHAGRDLRWMLVILAGLLLPLGAALAIVAWGAPVAVGLAVALAALVATDAPLVAAGSRGQGAVGVVQPWRWPAYLGWLVIRLLLLAAVVVARDG